MGLMVWRGCCREEEGVSRGGRAQKRSSSFDLTKSGRGKTAHKRNLMHGCLRAQIRREQLTIVLHVKTSARFKEDYTAFRLSRTLVPL